MGNPAACCEGFFLRVLASGLYSHVLYTGLVGMAVGVVVSRRGDVPLGARVRIAAGLTAIAVFGHFLWNSPLLDLFPDPPWTGLDLLVVPLATAVKGLPLLVFVGVAVQLARRRERRWLRGAFAAEVGEAGISRTSSPTWRIRAGAGARRATMRARAGDRAADLLARLQREQVNLAMVRTRVARDDDPALVEQREYCRSLRDALMAIPGAAPADAGASARASARSARGPPATTGRLRPPWT